MTAAQLLGEVEGQGFYQATGGLELGRINVASRGVGIAPEDIPKIFDEFVQLQKTHNEQGTGLGLPISSRLATLLNGELEVESVPGEGSTFRLSLPSNVEQPRVAASPVLDRADGAGAGRGPARGGAAGSAHRPGAHRGADGGRAPVLHDAVRRRRVAA